MRNTSVSGQRVPADVPSVVAPTATPSAVPITIYRELSADLKESQAAIALLQFENQQLNEQNQVLRQELERIANQTQKAIYQVGQLHSVEQPSSLRPEAEPLPVPTHKKRRRPVAAAEALIAEPSGFEPYRLPDFAPEDTNFMAGNDFGLGQLFPAPQRISIKRVKSRVKSQFASDHGFSLAQLQQLLNFSELTGWKLTLVMALITLSAFGAGFLVVRPLLTPHSPANAPAPQQFR